MRSIGAKCHASYSPKVSGRMVGNPKVARNGLGVREANIGRESYLPWKMAWLMSGQNSRNTLVIPSREAFRNHR
jgi:hypothetical protein